MTLIILFHPDFELLVTYGIGIWCIAFIIWLVVVLARIRLVGFLPSDVRDDDVIPLSFQPLIRWWLMVRFGLLGSWLLVVLIALGLALVERKLASIAIQTLLYLAWGRMLLDAAFGAVFNAGIISMKRK